MAMVLLFKGHDNIVSSPIRKGSSSTKGTDPDRSKRLQIIIKLSSGGSESALAAVYGGVLLPWLTRLLFASPRAPRDNFSRMTSLGKHPLHDLSAPSLLLLLSSF